MGTVEHKVIFFHGFGSSPSTNKFTAIEHANKVCVHVDYSTESYDAVYSTYSQLVKSTIDEGFLPILVGHSLGGYWALKMAEQFGTSVVLINPQLWPTNPKIQDLDRYDTVDKSSVPTYVYVETGDEVIEVARTLVWADGNTMLRMFDGGHHRVEHLTMVNTLVEHAMRQELVS